MFACILARSFVASLFLHVTFVRCCFAFPSGLLPRALKYLVSAFALSRHSYRLGLNVVCIVSHVCLDVKFVELPVRSLSSGFSLEW